uniref:RDD family protein n=1 Tax=Roseihalotalea indica TaxID=2867963 RepID=A0AA49JHI7_9BACT|nr:RDD family protein [Tunicatimonas sp. TK19036]
MQSIKIQTTQNVTIEYTLAGLGNRILAYLIDSLILGVYAIAAVLLFSYLSPSGEPPVALLIVLFLPIFLYHLLCEMLLNGQSLGKRQMNIKVVKLDGSPPGFGAYLLRWLLRPIDISIFSGGIAILSIAISQNDQRLGDLAAGTTVVKTKGEKPLSVFTVDEDYEAQFPQVVNLSDQDIETVLRVITTYRETGHTAPVEATARKIEELLDIKSDLRPLQFLYTIVRDYKHITAK